MDSRTWREVLIHLDLFSGIGGFALAAQWAGYETVLFVEIDPWCQKVLKKHWPNVPIIGDIRDVTKETLAHTEGWSMWNDCQDFGATNREVHTPDNTGVRGGARAVERPQSPAIDLLTGGFPCQPFSVAGKRGGTSDNRYLWPEMCRVIGLLKPRWVIAENVPGLLAIENGLVFDRVLSDLEGQGYEVGTVVLPACAVNAPHRRDRVWIVAHRASDGLDTPQLRQLQGNHGTATTGAEDATKAGRPRTLGAVEGREDVADTNEQGPQGHGREHGLPARSGQGATCGRGECDAGDHWAVEPNVGRVAHGIPRRVDRLRGLGNSIVPQVAYQIMKAINGTS